MTESELLFTEILDCSRDKLYLNKGCMLTNQQSCFLADALKRRSAGEPIQYILGKTEFMGLGFRLTSDVFIPRPETEILVETAIKFSYQLSEVRSQKTEDRRQRTEDRRQLKILDVGTGSGCIAISLAKFLKNAQVCATDISKGALKIARQNALLNNVEINFLESNLFSNYELKTIDYELIISNPPYIPGREINYLAPELGYEPRIALDGGGDGLEFYRRIIKQVPGFLKPCGFLIMEMGFGQYPAIERIFNDCGAKFKIIEVVKDYQGIDRVIVAGLNKTAS
ncbi:MAG: peptide chain release factor N(5)-glutamine methyltransferase [Candidatus Omnitrophota bacterium]